MENINTLSLIEILVLMFFILFCAFLVYFYYKNVTLPIREDNKKRMEELIKEREFVEEIKKQKEDWITIPETKTSDRGTRY